MKARLTLIESAPKGKWVANNSPRSGFGLSVTDKRAAGFLLAARWPRASKVPLRPSSVPHRLHYSRLINGPISGRRGMAKLAYRQNSPYSIASTMPIPSGLGAGRPGLASTVVGRQLSWL
jgi:hypothetical protein